jgi:hypothetical protein
LLGVLVAFLHLDHVNGEGCTGPTLGYGAPSRQESPAITTEVCNHTFAAPASQHS